MIHELHQSKSIAIALDNIFPEALAVVSGNNPGWVFVDDPIKPDAALVWAKGIEGFYLVGDADSKVFQRELNIYTDQVLKPRLNHLGKTWLEICGDETWDPTIEMIYKNQNLESSQQWVYTLQPIMQKKHLQQKLVGDCETKRIEKHLVDDLSPDSKEFLFAKLEKFWSNLDTFMRMGLGYVLMDGEDICSLCFSGFVAKNIHVIDIETKESHRRKGFAGILGQTYIAECAEKGFRLHWDCMSENTASAHLAEKLGFTRNHVYTLYSLPL